MSNDPADDATELVSEQIDRMMAMLAADTSHDPAKIGSRLAELVSRRAALDSDRLHRAESTMSALRRAHDRIRSARGLVDIIDAVCPAVASIARTDDVVLHELDGMLATPVATSARDRVPRPFSAQDAVAEDGRLPLVFGCKGMTVFRLDVDGGPRGLVAVAGSLDSDTVRAVRAFVTSVGAAIALTDMRERRNRHRELYASISGWRRHAGIVLRPETSSAVSLTVPEALTRREAEIFRMMLTGSSNAAIAEQLVVSIETVKSHVKQILRKCDAANRAELIGRYGRAGMSRSIERTAPAGAVGEFPL
ncbi:helix-turn-helix transcriptional regulator [Nocardia higoensis]|uniref:helix-turn-helix transcriptional regulator n=1 Tax=Nocardia higoensis TaxID=228599 RepID=UPI00031B9FFB|nr:LuxR C-terminal-related transcriptional regulator [Nocardia higoensis]